MTLPALSVVFNNAVDIAVEADPTAALYVTFRAYAPANPLDNPIPTPGPDDRITLPRVYIVGGQWLAAE